MTGPRDAVRVAMRISASIGIAAGRADVLPGGNENVVVRVRSGGDDVVVRVRSDPARAAEPYDVEAWCLVAAERAGVRTSRPVAAGTLDGTAYLVAHHVPGSPATADDLDGWRGVGAFLSTLPRIRTDDAPDALFTRFGRDLDAAWDRHLAYNVDALEPADPLVTLGVYPEPRRAELVGAIESLRRRRLPQGLVHGDASHRNVVRDGDGVTVLDWGAAATGPVVWGDIERIARWRRQHDSVSPVSDEAWAAVLDGAGIDAATAEPIVRELAALRALDVTRWAIDRRPDLLDAVAADSRAVLEAMVFGPDPA